MPGKFGSGGCVLASWRACLARVGVFWASEGACFGLVGRACYGLRSDRVMGFRAGVLWASERACFGFKLGMSWEPGPGPRPGLE